MRTNEFREAIEELGFRVEIYSNAEIFINDCHGTFASIPKNKRYNVDTDWDGFDKFEETKQGELFSILTTYASTPIAEREEEKRYRVKLISKSIEEDVSYLNKWVVEGRYFLSDLSSTTDVKTIFTESELKTMDLTGFKKLEVTE